MDETENHNAEVPDSPASSVGTFEEAMKETLQPELPNKFVRNRDVMLRYLEGQSIDEIAEAKFIPAARVKAILGTKYVREELQRLATLANDRYVQERIDALTIEALDKVRDTLRGANPSELQFKAAKEILDKNPLFKQKTDESGLRELGAGLGETIITRLAQQDAERRSALPPPIDITPDGTAGKPI